MKSSLIAAAWAAMMALPVASLPNDGLLARAGCNKDNCLRAVLASSVRVEDCSSYMAVTVTPCASTVTAASTITVTTTSTLAGTYIMKRDEIAATPLAALEARQAGPSCVATTNSASLLPRYASTACTNIGTTAPAARFSSACVCNGVSAVPTTIPAETSTVTATQTITVSITPTPSPYILQSTGDPSLYITVDDKKALRLTQNTTAAVPFYIDNSGQLRNWHNPAQVLVDYYQPSPNTADNTLYLDTPSSSNYALTCSYFNQGTPSYWFECQASGPPNGNPVVYGFGTCPNEGYYVYMIPNDSNVNCYDGGYAFAGFNLLAYTGK